MFTIKHNIPQIKDKLERLKKLATGKASYQEGLKAKLKDAVTTVRRKTPRSSGVGSQSGSHLASGWTLHTIGGGGKDRVPLIAVIYNRFTHNVIGTHKPEALLRVKKTGTVKDYTLLEVLEYGSPPHKIEAVDSQVLHFNWVGNEVFAKSVWHPGTRPYGMVRVTRAKLAVALKSVFQRWNQKLLREWSRK